MQLGLLTERQAMTGGQSLQCHETDVVARAQILRTGVAKANHKPELIDHACQTPDVESVSSTSDPGSDSGSAMALLISLSNSLEAD